jgi:hypothetical protein
VRGLGEGGAERGARECEARTAGGGREQQGGMLYERGQGSGGPMGWSRAELTPAVEVVARVALQVVSAVGREADEEEAQREHAQRVQPAEHGARDGAPLEARGVAGDLLAHGVGSAGWLGCSETLIRIQMELGEAFAVGEAARVGHAGVACEVRSAAPPPVRFRWRSRGPSSCR